MGRKRYHAPINGDDAKLERDIRESQLAMERGLTAERFAMRAQKLLREMGGTQADAELLAGITDDGGAGEERPVSAYMKFRAEQLFTELVKRRQLAEMA